MFSESEKYDTNGGLLLCGIVLLSMGPLLAQIVKNLLAMWETQVRFLSWEDPLELRMATHSSILAWRIPWTEKPGGLQSMKLQRVGYDWVTNTFTLFHFSLNYNGQGKKKKMQLGNSFFKCFCCKIRGIHCVSPIQCGFFYSFQLVWVFILPRQNMQ